MARITKIGKAKQIYINSSFPITPRQLAKMVGAKEHKFIYNKMVAEKWEEQRITRDVTTLEDHTPKNKAQQKNNVVKMPRKGSDEQVLLDLYTQGKKALAGSSLKLVAKWLNEIKNRNTTLDEDYKISAIIQRMGSVYNQVFDGYIEKYKAGEIEEDDIANIITFDEQLKKIVGE